MTYGPLIEAKFTVRMEKTYPVLLRGLADLAELWASRVGSRFIITSMTDGAHKQESFHYKGLAFDLRTHHVPVGATERVFEEFRATHPGWDVLHEDVNGPNQHGHLEYDPKE